MSNRNAEPSATRNIPEMNFKDLRLSKPVLRAVQDEGHESPTLIQARAIPPILDGRDVLGFAPTGTGKTAAFTLPILQKLDGAHHQVLVNFEQTRRVLNVDEHHRNTIRHTL